MTDDLLCTIVCFGDSTTAERVGVQKVYADRLLDELNGVVDQVVCVINAGVGGNTTRLAFDRFEDDVLAHRPQLVIIQFGLNDQAFDHWRDPPAKASRVVVAEYIEHLRHFVLAVREQGGEAILMTPNAMVWTDSLKQKYGRLPYDVNSANGLNVLLHQYVQAMRQLAQEEGTALVDIFAIYQQKLASEGVAGLERLLLDGMHPNDDGHALVARELLPVITGFLRRNQSRTAG